MDVAARTYFALRESLSTFFSGASKEEDEEYSAILNFLMDEARIYSIDPADAVDMYQSIDRWTTTEIAGQTFVPGIRRRFTGEEEMDAHRYEQLTKEESEHHYNSIAEAGRNWPFPENLPFPVVFFIFGAGIILSPEASMLRRFYTDDRDPEVIYDELVRRPLTLLGYLLTDKGHVIEFTAQKELDMSSRVALHEIKSPEQDLVGRVMESHWRIPYTLSPWMVESLVRWVNSYHNVVIQRERPKLTMRRRLKEINKERSKHKLRKLRPPDFYTVHLKDRVAMIHEHGELKRIQRVFSHRWDVRGHERIYVRRGPLPLSPSKRHWLRVHGYTLYEHTQPTPKDEDRLALRGHHFHRRSDEWLALKSTWVKAHQAGPDDAPYVPAVRVPGARDIG